MGIETSVDKIEAGLADDLQEVLYTVPVLKKARVVSIIISNISTNTKYATIYHFQSGESTPGDAFIKGKKKFRLPGIGSKRGSGEYIYKLPFLMFAGESLQLVSETASSMRYEVIFLEEEVS